MRIVYFSRSFIPSFDANAVHVMNMCEALAQEGHDVLLLCPDRGQVKESINDFYGSKNKFTILHIPYPDLKGKALSYALMSIPHILGFRPDLVISRFLYGSLISTLFRAPVIHDFHGDDWNRTRIIKTFVRWLLTSKKLKKITFNSKGLLNSFMSQGFPVPNSLTVEILPNGSFINSLIDKAILPGQNVVKVGYFGSLYHGRGIRLIIEIAKGLKHIDFIIGGGTPEEIENLKNDYSSSNTFFLGHIQPRIVYRYRNSVDLLIAPYEKEVSMAGGTGNSVDFMNPLKIIEYMSSRKIILTSDLPAIREIANDDEVIFLPVNSCDSWIEMISKVSNNLKLYEPYAINSYEKFLKKYTWSARVLQMTKHFRVTHVFR